MTTKRLRNLLSHFIPHKPAAPASTLSVAEGPLPTFEELPKFHDFTGCAWTVWGKDDQLGTVNILTEKVVQQAAMEEIMYAMPPCSTSG